MESALSFHNVAKQAETLPGIVTVQCGFHWQCSVVQQELWSVIPNVTEWRVLQNVYTQSSTNYLSFNTSNDGEFVRLEV
jgi:hypothetical protein